MRCAAPRVTRVMKCAAVLCGLVASAAAAGSLAPLQAELIAAGVRRTHEMVQALGTAGVETFDDLLIIPDRWLGELEDQLKDAGISLVDRSKLMAHRGRIASTASSREADPAREPEINGTTGDDEERATRRRTQQGTSAVGSNCADAKGMDLRITSLSQRTAALELITHTFAAPIGSIVLWHGALKDIPVGWVYCDGSNGTPDLRDRFVVGAGKRYPIGKNVAKGKNVGAHGGWKVSTRICSTCMYNCATNKGTSGSAFSV